MRGSVSFIALGGLLVLLSCSDGAMPAAPVDGADGGGPAFSRGRDHVRGASGASLFEFDALTGVPRPFTGSANPVRGLAGGGLPWVLTRGEARLDEDGTLSVEVEGLVLDPNDPDVISRGLAGNNPVSAFRAVLSCLSVSDAGNVVTKNLATEAAPATTGVGGGDSRIEQRFRRLPRPCIAPIVFVTSPTLGWFAASGF